MSNLNAEAPEPVDEITLDSEDVGSADAPHGTRWRRAGIMATASMAVVMFLGSMIWTNSLGFNASIIIQNSPMSFSSSRIVANDVGFGVTSVQTQSGERHNVLRAGFASAGLNGLCVSKTESIAGIGNVTFRLTSGDGNAATQEIQAQNAAFDITSLRAQGATGIRLEGTVQLGLSTPDITTTPGEAPFTSNPLGQVPSGSPMLQNYQAGVYSAGSAGINGGRMNGQGWVGIDATRGTLETVRGTMWQAQVTGDILLPNLSIAIIPGTAQSCEAAAAAGSYPN